MTGRGWRWLVALTVVATAAIGVAGGLDFVRQSIFRPNVHCEDRAACRAFIRAEINKAIDKAIAKLRVDLRKSGEVIGGGGNHNPSGQPGGGPPPSPGQQGSGGGQGAGGGDGAPNQNTLDLPPICAQLTTTTICTPRITIGP